MRLHSSIMRSRKSRIDLQRNIDTSAEDRTAIAALPMRLLSSIMRSRISRIDL